jgi:excinuclease ABC subunit A
VARLLQVLSRLVESGNTVVVIEHNLDVIKTADWVIDLGPEGGDKGGSLVAAGTPEEIAATDASHTGRYLREVLAASPTSAAARPRTTRRRREPVAAGS